MRVIDAEKLDVYLTDVIQKSREAAYLYRQSGMHASAKTLEFLAQDLSAIANHIADEMVQEGDIYNHPTTTAIGDVTGNIERRQIHPLHSKE